MQVKLQTKNIELTEAIKDYVEKRVTNLEKLLTKMESQGTEALVWFEVGQSTKHHKSGMIFHSDCRVSIDGKEFYASADDEDLYASIDKVRDELFREINKNKDRRQTLFKRGATSIKKMMKRLTNRNPETAKYDDK